MFGMPKQPHQTDVYDLKPGTLFQIGNALAVRTFSPMLVPPNGYAHVGGLDGSSGQGGYWPVWSEGKFYAEKIIAERTTDGVFRLLTE